MATPAAAAAPKIPAPMYWPAAAPLEEVDALEWLDPLVWLDPLWAETTDTAAKARTTDLICMVVSE